MSTTDKMRREFEAWAVANMLDCDDSVIGRDTDGDYYYDDVECAWRGWQAAMASAAATAAAASGNGEG